MIDELVIRECLTLAEFDSCVRLQREVFRLPDLEVSPRRHLIVSKRAGGWTLGAFVADELIGFVHHLVALKNGEVSGYSHMMAVKREFQNGGIGVQLKWAQRQRAVDHGLNFIRWTWDPMQTRNAHFNLNRLGVVVREYAVNFYGTDYNPQLSETEANPGIDSDRLFADWHLNSDRVIKLSEGGTLEKPALPVTTIEVPLDWNQYVRAQPLAAREEQLRVRTEFQRAFAARLICAGFEHTASRAQYLLYHEKEVIGDK